MLTSIITENDRTFIDFFAELVTEHYDFILAYIKRRLKNNVQPHDVAQETFLAAWQSIADLQQHPKVRAWLVTTARYKMLHTISDDVKTQKAYSTVIQAEREKPAKKQDITELFKDLSNQESSVLLMYYDDEMSLSEIADAHKITYGAAKMCLSRARKKVEAAAHSKKLLKKITMLCYLLSF